ncbi:MAG: hypothetical protein WCW56_03235 [Candidatus Paceibacterota bacterium]|jgi:hypothetical protein
MKNIPILRWALTIGIVIVLNLFFYYATSLVYVEPKYENFCEQKQVNIQPTNQQACVTAGGAWNENTTVKAVPVNPGMAVSEQTEIKGYCDGTFTCQKKYQEARDLYNRNVFLVLVVLGVISLIAGFFLSFNMAVSLGLSFGGVLSFIIASIRYWSAMQEYLRVTILALALVALITLAIKKFQD